MILLRLFYLMLSVLVLCEANGTTHFLNQPLQRETMILFRLFYLMISVLVLCETNGTTNFPNQPMQRERQSSRITVSLCGMNIV